MHSPYYNPEALRQVSEGDKHRDAVGGLWDEMGQLQLDFLINQGLKPQHHLLDIGCGSLRFGRLAVTYLQAEHYFGQDISPQLIEAGYTKELTPVQRQKLPRQHLTVGDQFDFSHCTQPIDWAIAQSVFTHLPLNHLRFCLHQLEAVMPTGGTFYATFFLCPEAVNISEPYTHSGAEGVSPITTTPIADPYHYRFKDLQYATETTAFQAELIGQWNHPRGQQMVRYTKLNSPG